MITMIKRYEIMQNYLLNQLIPNASYQSEHLRMLVTYIKGLINKQTVEWLNR